LTGDVRNLPDGRVEVRVEGNSGAIARLRETVRSGPPGARVDAIRDEPLAAGVILGTFETRY